MKPKLLQIHLHWLEGNRKQTRIKTRTNATKAVLEKPKLQQPQSKCSKMAGQPEQKQQKAVLKNLSNQNTVPKPVIKDTRIISPQTETVLE
jgi:hypothetical protein